MRNYKKIIGAMAVASAFAAGNASAVELSYNLHAGYASEYIFRGANLGNDLIEAGADVNADFGGGFSISGGVWYADFDAPLGFAQADKSATEIDLYTKASYDLGFLTASVGYIYYYNDQDDVEDFLSSFGGGSGHLKDAQEVTFGVSKEIFGINTSLTYFYDIVLDNDGYTELAASKSFEFSPCLALNVGSALGYLVEEGHLAHLTTKVSLDWGFAEHAKLSPFAALSIDLSGGHGIAYGEAKNELVGGAAVSVDF